MDFAMNVRIIHMRLVLGLAIGFGIMAGCAAETSEDEGDDVTSSEDELKATELTCVSSVDPKKSFAIKPGLGGASVQGTLTTSQWKSTFACSDITSKTLRCLERPQSVHPGRYEMVVVQSGKKYRATLSSLGTSPGEAFTCSDPGAADAGKDSSSDAKDAASDAKDGGSVNDAGSEAATSGDYDAAAAVVKSTCNKCHTGMWTTESKLGKDRVQILAALKSGRMPRGASSTWKTSEQGLALIEYLESL